MNNVRKAGLLLFAWSLMGLVAAEAAEIKIGVVSLGRVFQEAPQARTTAKKLEKEFSPRKKKLQESEKRIKEKEERLLRDSAVMNETERRKSERELISMKRALKRSQEEFREDLNIRQNEEFNKLQQIISRVIDELAKEKGFDLILGENVIFASSEIDVTQEVLDRLNKDSTAR